MPKELIKAVGYMRTSSATNVGADKDSDKRQRAAISGYAEANGFEVVDWYYDAAVSGTHKRTQVLRGDAQQAHDQRHEDNHC